MAMTETLKGRSRAPQPVKVAAVPKPKQEIPSEEKYSPVTVTPGELREAFYDQLAEMSLDALWDICKTKGMAYQSVSRADLIEMILTQDEREYMQSIGAVSPEYAEPPLPEVIEIPADINFADGKLTMSMEDLAICYASLLPPETIMNLHAGSVERWAKSSFRKGVDTVVFSFTDEGRNNRRYEVTMPKKAALPAKDLG